MFTVHPMPSIVDGDIRRNELNAENLISTQTLILHLRSTGEFLGRGTHQLSIAAVKDLGFTPAIETPSGALWDKSILQNIIPALDDHYPKTIKPIDVKVTPKGKLKNDAPKSIDDRISSIEQKLNKIIKLLM